MCPETTIPATLLVLLCCCSHGSTAAEDEPADLSAQRGATPTPTMEAEQRAISELIRELDLQVIELPSMETYRDGACTAKDPPVAEWSSRVVLGAALAGAGVKQECGNTAACVVPVTVSEERWGLARDDLRKAVASYMAARVADTDFRPIEFTYPSGYQELKDAYRVAAEKNTNIQGTSTPYVLVDIPRNTERMIQAMLFYAFDAHFVRHTRSTWSSTEVNAAIDAITRDLDRYVGLQYQGLVVPYVLSEMGWTKWKHATPEGSHDEMVQAFFMEDRAEIEAESWISGVGRNWSKIEIGEGGHFPGTRFIVPTADLPQETKDLLTAGVYPIGQPECYFGTRWWYDFVVWQIASREGTSIDFAESTFIHGQPRMAWYPSNYVQFGPP